MKTLPNVPVAVQSYLNELLNGSPPTQDGLTHYVANFDKAIENGIEMHEQATKESIFFKDTIEHIKLLLTDPRMGDAYSLLSSELKEDHEWRNFFSSALRSNFDYASHRDAVKKGQELARKIAAAATHLAELLSEMQEMDLDNTPKCFFNLRHLLYETKSYDLQNTRANKKWLKARTTIVGKHFSPEKDFVDFSEYCSPGSIGELLNDETKRLSRKIWNQDILLGEPKDKLDRAWQRAPKIKTILKSLAYEAAQYSPAQMGMVGAATASRKSLHKIEFIRGFGHLISEEHNISINRNIIKAISIVTTVLINDPNIDVSYDDVRKALK